MEISIHEKNPFKNNKVGCFNLEGCRESARLYDKAEKFWKN
jgi:hypothetical protein